MFAVFHGPAPSGYVATCPTFPDWVSSADSLNESVRHAERSLRDHIATTVTFDHYQMPADFEKAA